MPLSSEFDFDAMAMLAKEAPLEFARKREELIRRAIESCASLDSAESIQNDIDIFKAQATDGRAAYVVIMEKGLNALVGRVSERLAAIHSCPKEYAATDKRY